MDFLQRVTRERLEHVAAERAAGIDPFREAARAQATRPFADALRARRASGGLPVVAEVKRRSPALGLLSADLDPASLARAYVDAGTAAVSVLTEPRHWNGSLDDLARVRAAVDVPVLCKDVIVDAHQLAQARAAGADAVLLIAEALDDRQLGLLIEQARALGLETLLEAHEADAFTRAARHPSSMLGVNARDLRAPERLVPGRVWELAGLAPAGTVLIAESGIRDAADARALPRRVDAVLVGTALIRAADPAALIRELTAAEPGTIAR